MISADSPFAPIDQALVALGFVRKFQAMQVSWTGHRAGRNCVVRIAPQRRTYYAGDVRYRTTLGYRLRIELQTSVPTQVFFVTETFSGNAIVRWLYKWRKQAIVRSNSESLRGFVAVTIDEDWTQQLLDQSEVINATGRLLHQDANVTMTGSVHLAPTSAMSKVYFASPILAAEQISEARLLAAIGDLETIAACAERLPTPRVVHELSPLGLFSEQHPWVVAIALLLGLSSIAVLGGLTLFFAAVIIHAAAR